jgi:hypothetical protein
MKKLIFFALIPLFLFMITGCSNNGGGTGTTDPFGIGSIGNNGGDGTGNVTFQVALVQDNQGTLEFGFNMDVSVKLTSVVVTEADLNINDTVDNPNPDQTIDPAETGSYYAFYQPQQQLQTGQKWSFKFSGTIADGGAAYTQTVNYTVQ